MTTAYELTRPEHAGRFEVTVYQMGFRLGGKGASGRGPGARIEEHGLHLWLGFYENAFRIMRDCYAELGRDSFRCPVATFEQAFRPAPVVAVTDRGGQGEWEPWVAHFPSTPGIPGDALDGDSPFSPAGYLIKAAKLVVELLRSSGEMSSTSPSASSSARPPFEAPGETAPTAEKLVEMAEWLVRHGQLATTAALAEGMNLVLLSLQWMGHGVPGAATPLVQLLSAISRSVSRQLQHLVAGDPQLRRVWQVIDLILACIRGAIAHGLLVNPQGFDAVDDYDWREWLSLHGASAESLDSGFMRGIYDLAFAYEGGDPNRPRLSAAVALRGAMRMFFTYKGSLFWRMSAGMGDIVFAPLYEVLKRRGVRFEFFHRFEGAAVGDDASGKYVSELRFSIQAKTKSGAPYEPLVDVHGLPCWPAQPDYDQLEDGEAAKRNGVHFESPWEERIVEQRVLSVQQDFDYVVLALGGGAVPSTCAELMAHSPNFREAMSHLNTVATQALQIWTTPNLGELGWTHPPVNLSGWVEPFDTWADMSHLIPAEDFPHSVGAIAYFCSPLPDAVGDPAAGMDFDRSQSERVKQHAVQFLERDIRALWPNAVDQSSGGFRWDLLAAPQTAQDGQQGQARIETQYWSANVRPSERYALSLPGTSRFRLSPLNRSFDNMTVAGDWTASGLNTGCVESAVISGRLAAHALSGAPALKDIVGYDHP
jgi:uncharacterized protein with NAD-binding domain and iron-sulfur cluster